MPTPTPELFTLLAAEAERTLDVMAVSRIAVSVWERELGRLRTLVKVGAVDESLPTDECYPLDTFPSTDALLRFGRPYLDPQDLASLAVMAQIGYASQAGVPIVAEGRVWGELWAGVEAGGRRLTAADLAPLVRGAEAIGRLLSERGDA